MALSEGCVKVQGDHQEQMDSFVCEIGDCLGESELLVCPSWCVQMGKLFKTCLLWLFSPFWDSCPDLRLLNLIEVSCSRSFNETCQEL